MSQHTQTVTIHQAKTQLSHLLKEGCCGQRRNHCQGRQADGKARPILTLPFPHCRKTLTERHETVPDPICGERYGGTLWSARIRRSGRLSKMDRGCPFWRFTEPDVGFAKPKVVQYQCGVWSESPEAFH